MTLWDKDTLQSRSTQGMAVVLICLEAHREPLDKGQAKALKQVMLGAQVAGVKPSPSLTRGCLCSLMTFHPLPL